MAERWQHELTKLHGGRPPEGLWGRVAEGPRMDPIAESGRSRLAAAAVAVVVFALAVALALRAFGPLRDADRTLGGPDILRVPPSGETAPAFLPDGHPIFIVHHEDDTVSVVDAFSSHRPYGFEEVVVWCPTTRDLVEWAHEAHYDESGNWYTGGPAYAGLPTFAFEVVDTDAGGNPTTIRVGAMRAPDPGGSAHETDPSTYPAFCPPDGAFVTHAIDPQAIYDTPEDAVAAAPEGWVAVRGTLLVDDEDAFVQLCSEVAEGVCVDGVPVRGLDSVRFLLKVLRPNEEPLAYEEPQVWLVKVREGIIDDPAGVSLFEGAGGGVYR
jgi:hypothetical protein